jgi:hypothetical protein
MHAEHWKVIALLWVIPAVLGIIAAIRLLRNRPPITKREESFFFRANAITEITPGFGIKLVALALILFCVGVGLGLVVVNIGSPLAPLAPLGTALATMLILVWWLRSTPGVELPDEVHTREEEKNALADSWDAFEL